jgi:hypothetical protein
MVWDYGEVKPVQRSARQLCLRFLFTLATFRRGKGVVMARDVQSLLRQLEGVAEEIRRRYRAEIVGIFGSYVRREQRETSDLDVLVRFTAIKNVRKSAHSSLPAPTCFVDHRRI